MLAVSYNMLPHYSLDPSEINLTSIQKEIDDKAIPLHVKPKEPETSFPINQEHVTEMRDYINEGKVLNESGELITQDEIPSLLSTVDKIATNIQHLTMPVLKQKLQECVASLNNQLKEEPNKSYSIGITCGKSQQWIASLALSSLDHLPKSWFSLSERQGTTGVVVPKSEDTVSDVQEDILVLFDDSSYSGTQLSSNLAKIDRLIATPKTIYVIIPFMSSIAKERIRELENDKLTIKLITSDISLKLINEIFQKEETKNAELLLGRGSIGPYNSKTLAYCDWRFPDGTSIASPSNPSLNSVFFRRRVLIDDDIMYCFRKLSFFPDPNLIKRPYEIASST